MVIGGTIPVGKEGGQIFFSLVGRLEDASERSDEIILPKTSAAFVRKALINGSSENRVETQSNLYCFRRPIAIRTRRPFVLQPYSQT